MQKLGEMWKKLSDKDKKKYNEMNKKDKVRYEKAMEEYNEKYNVV